MIDVMHPIPDARHMKTLCEPTKEKKKKRKTGDGSREVHNGNNTPITDAKTHYQL